MALPAHPVVIDNTTLSNFALVGRADLVTGLWGERASTTSLVMNEYLAGVEGGILSPDTSTLAENDPLVLARSDPHEDRVLAARSSSSSAAGAVIGTVWSSAVTTTIRLVV